MIYYNNIQDSASIFRCFSSETRLRILEAISENGEMNITDIASFLKITPATTSAHIKELVDNHLIQIRTIPAAHGNQKLCSLKEEKLIVDLISSKKLESHSLRISEIPIGQYTDYEILPTCLIATTEGAIGEYDDIRYFSYPQRYKAAMLCFGEGYIEYGLPNPLNRDEKPQELQLSFEIASEAPGTNENYPSDIYFSINNVNLGYWTSPGDYGKRRGYLTPSWHPTGLNQYGLLKILIINGTGTYIDGNTKLSEITINDLDIHYQSKIIFRIASPKTAKNRGGVSLFGRGFGNYNQDIVFKLTI